VALLAAAALLFRPLNLDSILVLLVHCTVYLLMNFVSAASHMSQEHCDDVTFAVFC